MVFSEIPAKLKKYFPEENVILHVRPDGGVSCFSAHMFAQPHKGKHLRREVNKHMVSNWDYYKNKIGFPYERQVGVAGATVKDSDPFQFLNFLQTPETEFLWTDSEEIQSMCNLYQMNATRISSWLASLTPPW